MDPILDDLNEPQREAVLHEEGPLLVVAGAGSGKTRVITRRIAHLVRRGHPPGSILGLTFTNKAAGEMRERVGRLAGTGGVFLSTFHAMGARFLRVHGPRIGIPADYTIYDAEEQRTLVREVLRSLALDTTRYRPDAVAARISRLKNEETPPEEARESGNYYLRVVGRVFEAYEQAKRENGALDFDDLLLETVRLLEEDDETLEQYRRRFRFILIDEYQDTNPVQYRIAKLLAGPARNLCATGDPDQSIYTWRGATIRNILEFEKDFPGAKVVKLEQNYRSTGNVLRAASAVIAHNRLRKERELWTEAPDGEPVTLFEAGTEAEEAEFVVRAVLEERRAGRSLADMAVFFRTNALSRPFERSLALANLPYVIVGGVEFYERREIKDVMAYLKLLDNPRDGISFLRIVNVPARGIGDRTVERVKAAAEAEGCPLLEGARRCLAGGRLKTAAARAMERFLGLYEDLAARPRRPVAPLIEAVLEVTEYGAHLEAIPDPVVRQERKANVDELLSAAAEYDRSTPDGSLHGFLEETALVRGIDLWEPEEDRLTLMTLHSAKGLEFKVVFIAGVEEGLLPHLLSMDREEGVEEERRLFYVGITRAREKLYLTRSEARIRNGSLVASLPSRFLDELPPGVLEVRNAPAAYRRRGRPGYRGAGRHGARPLPDPEGPVIEYDGECIPEFKAGDRVFHPDFGRGEVLRVQGKGLATRIKVRFPAGEKLLAPEYARLKKVL